MYINTFKYTPEDVDCKLCTEYVKKFGCTACGCPWMAERIEAGVVSYAEVVRQMFPHDKRLMARLEPLIRDFPGMLWQDERHRQRMEGVKIHLGHSKRRDTPAFFAVIFLFTSDEDIYRRAGNCRRPGVIPVKRAEPGDQTDRQDDETLFPFFPFPFLFR